MMETNETTVLDPTPSFWNRFRSFLARKDIVFSAKRYGIDALGAMALGLTGVEAFSFTAQEAASIAIIGGADGPTAIFLTYSVPSWYHFVSF